MKIDLNTLDLENFNLKDGILNGHVVYLIVPVEFKCKWTRQTLHLRSVLVDYNGHILSRGLPKFFNIEESPELYPDPKKYKDWILTNKEDGSLMICDYIFDKLNVRTRGTISYGDHENTSDFDSIISKYNLKHLVKEYVDYSILFELYSPTNVIILKPYNEPEIVFLGAIQKETGVYYPFYTSVGKEIQSYINCKVPEIFSFSNNIVDIVETINNWKHKEGGVLNYNNSQNQIKFKSEWYLIRHRLKDEFRNFERVLDFYIKEGCPSFHVFQEKVANVVDWEIANRIIGDISTCVDAWKEVQSIISGMTSFVANTRQFPTRKQVAEAIISSYGITNRASFCFKIYDNKPLDNDDLKKLFYQVTKK